MSLKQVFLAGLLALCGASASAESAEIFSYSLPDGNSGLRIAWRADSAATWKPLDYDFVKNDFGPWGSHKKMYRPKLLLNAADSLWTAVWDATASGDVVAMSTSADFKAWSPQRYFASAADLPRDMRPLNPLRPDTAEINGVRVEGWVQTIPEKLLASMRGYVGFRKILTMLYAEQAKDDDSRFAGLGSVAVSLTPNPAGEKKISDKLIGIFFEDINYGADGGLYAELVQNRDFEYTPSDRRGDKNWNSLTAWTQAGDGSVEILTDKPIHPNNPHYAAVRAVGSGFVFENSGFDSIAVEKGKSYLFSMKARAPKATKIDVRLVDASGRTIASRTVSVGSTDWTEVTAKLRAGRSATNARLQLVFRSPGRADLDMVSLFPAHTFKGRRNGLRDDLARTLAEIKPRFVRFPGGCVAHGDGIDNIYDWKGSIGPLEARRPLRNLWGYHQTRGMGYHEYFLFCEDIGAEPLPVLAAGVPCQNSGDHAHHSDCTLTSLGQQNGIPMEEMPAYVADVLDLIEYANGDVSTEWGAKRAAAGHPEPFGLKYIGIGNEDMITEVFEPRFKMIFDAVRERYPDITVIGTVGPFYEGSDYDAGWELARRLSVPMVDEHYYVEPGWFVYNRDFYDSYPRGGTKVYLGEYASHLPGRPCNVETALSVALYLTSVERNADVVEMTSYAPLLAKKGHTQWNPDLIYFDNTSVEPTTDYYVQQIFGNNSGDTYIPSKLAIDSDSPKVRLRIGASIVKDSATGDYIFKMVNFLPVEATIDIDLAPLGIDASSAMGTILTGTPDDRSATPRHADISLPKVTLPPYSLLTFRVK